MEDLPFHIKTVDDPVYNTGLPERHFPKIVILIIYDIHEEDFRFRMYLKRTLISSFSCDFAI